MTTYIKKIVMAPIDTLEEYQTSIEDELEYIRDSADTLLDLANGLDSKDHDAVMWEEVNTLRRMNVELEDTVNNISMLVKGYVEKLSTFVNE